MHERTLHWREYAIEAWALGTFMFSACGFGALVFHPALPVAAAALSPVWQRALMGVCMGLTLVGLAHSPWGKRSGAHMNPAFTLAFLRLGRIAPVDALGYITAQFAGGALGVWLSVQLFGSLLAHPAINYVVTQPGSLGTVGALTGEFVISAAQMTLVLHLATSRWSRFTARLAAVALATWITFEAPLSGMSMNPARTVASAVFAADWPALWVYFAGPMAGMLTAALVFAARRTQPIPCGKLVHAEPCLFCAYVARGGNPSPIATITAPRIAP
jgi:aquaporin Z